MLDVLSGGRLVAGFPVGTPMDTNYCYGQIPALDARQVRARRTSSSCARGRRRSRSPSTASTTSSAG